MSKNDKIIIGFSIVAVLVTIGVIFYQKKKAVKYYLDSPVNKGNTSTDSSFPLTYGARGSKVKELQSFLNSQALSGTKLDVDGIWGPKTDARVKQVLGTSTISQDFYNKTVKA